MNNSIILSALMEFALNDANTYREREAAFKEYNRLSEEINRDKVTLDLQRFINYRQNYPDARIQCVKMVREHFDCGLRDALIIVKGIESHFGIPA